MDFKKRPPQLLLAKKTFLNNTILKPVWTCDIKFGVHQVCFLTSILFNGSREKYPNNYILNLKLAVSDMLMTILFSTSKTYY